MDELEIYDQKKVFEQQLILAKKEGYEEGRKEGLMEAREEREKHRSLIIKALMSKMGLSFDEAKKIAEEALSV